MTSLAPRSALPLAALIAAGCFLVSAVAHVVVVRAPFPVHAPGFSVVQAEIHACESNSDRSHDECLDEIEGKALIQRAEWLAQAEERRTGVRDDAQADLTGPDADARAPRSSAQ